MMSSFQRVVTKAVLICAAFAFLPACAPTLNPSGSDAVSKAYETSGVIAVQPYTRSIINTHNF